MSALDEIWGKTCRDEGRRTAVRIEPGGAGRTFEEIEEEVAATKLGGSRIVPCAASDPVAFLVTFLAARRRGLVFLPLDRTLPPAEQERIVRRLREEDLPASAAMLKLTSGSTGEPKGIVLTEKSLLAGARSIVATMGIGRSDLNLAVVSLAHSYGFDNLVLPLILQGTPLLFLDTFYPRTVLEAISRWRATFVPLVPFMYGSLAGLPGDWSSVGVCISAGAMLPPETATSFFERSGRKIHSFYGSSECGGICYDRGEEPVLPAGCVGTPMEGVRVALTAEGRVRVESDGVAMAYAPHEADGSLQSGAFLTGDLGRFDGAGRLVLTGRAGDVINVAGKKVHPSEIEACLRGVRGVRAAAVIGVSDPRRGESVGALVVADGLGEEDILAHCRSLLAEWKVPRLVRLVPSLPYDERGKLSRAAVRRLLA